MRYLAALGVLCISVPSGLANAAPPSRGEVVATAQSYAEYRWEASGRNVLRGTDRANVLVQTPNRTAEDADPDQRLWSVGKENVGVPYKWGGFDSLESFAAGVRAGKAAGDLYSTEKRRKGGDAVSPYAVGVDCSGFISRCWQLPKKYSTDSIISLCQPLSSPAELLPGDVMNAAGGHVLLFAKWLDEQKSLALFYEAEPFSKVLASKRAVAPMIAQGFQPLRYRQIRE